MFEYWRFVPRCRWGRVRTAKSRSGSLRNL